MRNWLTVHYPHYQPDVEPWHIYLQRPHKSAVAGIQKGDRVFFYELAGRRARVDRPERPTGAQGVVRVGYVSGDAFMNTEGITKYDDGTEAQWCWEVPVGDLDCEGFVSRFQLCELLGFKTNYTFRGFAGGTGVQMLAPLQGDRLLETFKAGSRAQ